MTRKSPSIPVKGTIQRVTTGLLALLVSFCAYHAFCFWMAESALARDPTRIGLGQAVQWYPNEDFYHYLLGVTYRDSVEEQDLEAAIAELQRAVQLNPKNFTYYDDLAVALELRGDEKRAQKTFHQTLQLNPHSSQTYWQLANFHLRAQNLAEAIHAFQRAVQIDPSRLKAGAGRLAAFGLTEEEIADKLVLPRRDYLLSFLEFTLNRLHQQPDRAARLARRLWQKLIQADQREPLDISSAYPYLDFLLRNDYLKDAQWVWSSALHLSGQNLPREETQRIVFNGGFERDPLNGGLDWILPADSTAAQTILDSHERFRGLTSLRIDFLGQVNLDYSGVKQQIILPTGQLELSFAAKCEKITSDEGMQVEIRSVSDHSLIASSRPLLGTHPWHLVVAGFEVARPMTAYLVVRRYPSRKFDNLLGGRIWLDEFQLSQKKATD